eukprot:7644355-Lingulodinium_polyedra.AAC.1
MNKNQPESTRINAREDARGRTKKSKDERGRARTSEDERGRPFRRQSCRPPSGFVLSLYHWTRSPVYAMHN